MKQWLCLILAALVLSACKTTEAGEESLLSYSATDPVTEILYAHDTGRRIKKEVQLAAEEGEEPRFAEVELYVYRTAFRTKSGKEIIGLAVSEFQLSIPDKTLKRSRYWDKLHIYSLRMRTSKGDIEEVVEISIIEP